MPWRALCTRAMSWRERTSISDAFLMAPSICAAMPLRRARSAATSGSSGGSLAAGGAPSLAICERTSSSGLRRLSTASLALFSIFSMPVRSAARSRWLPGDCSRFFSAASMALCRLLTGRTISSIDGPLDFGAGGGGVAGGAAAGAAGVACGAGARGGVAGGPGVGVTGAALLAAGAFGAAGVAAAGAGACACAMAPFADSARPTPRLAAHTSAASFVDSERRIRKLPADYFPGDGCRRGLAIAGRLPERPQW